MEISVIKYSPRYKQDGYARIASFDCNNTDINRLFRKDLDKLHTTTYFFVDKSSNGKIIAFLSLCASAIQFRKKGLHALPAVELKLFAVDKQYQKNRFEINGKMLKYSEIAFEWLVSYAKTIIRPVLHVEYLVLYSVPQTNTLKFYEKMGMQYLTQSEALHQDNFSTDCIPMYLKLD